MELKQLQFLVVCVQTQSFSKAANLLFTAQSNVSKVIKSLEDELGVELFERKQYGIALTDRGKRVYEYAVSTLENAQKIMDYTKEEIIEELRISCNPSSWMATTFRKYYNEKGRDDISYHIMSASTNEIIRRLSNDLDDLGFIFVMEEQLPILQASFARNHISFTELKRTNAVLYLGNTEAVDTYQKKVDENKPVLLVQGYEDEFTLKSYLDASDTQDTQENRVKHRVAVTTNSDYIMRELLEHTSLGNISSGYLGEEKEQKSYQSLPLYEEDTPVLFGCLFRNDQNLGKRSKEFLSYVKEKLNEKALQS